MAWASGQAELVCKGKMPILFDALLSALRPPSKKEKKWRKEKSPAYCHWQLHTDRASVAPYLDTTLYLEKRKFI